MANRYADPVLKKVIEILEKDGPKDMVGRYGIGDPANINRSQLAKAPLGFLQYSEQSLYDDASREMRSTLSVQLTLVTDMTRDFGQGTDVYYHNTLLSYISGRDEKYHLKENTIMHALRKNQDFDEMRLWIDFENNPTRVSFDVTQRDKGLFCAEAILDFTLIAIQPSPAYATI